MNSEQIETFLAIFETGSIAHASDRLFLSQPTVSYRLKSLESDLGFTLFERQKGLRSVTLTAKGKDFIPIAQAWMQLWQDIRNLSADDTRIPLIISCPKSIQSHLVDPFCKALTTKKDAFKLSVQTGTVAEIYAAVSSETADIGLTFDLLSSDDLLADPVFEERLVLAKFCSEKNELRTAFHPSELNAKEEIYISGNNPFEEWHEKYFDKAVHPHAIIDHESALPELLQVHRSWAIIPASASNIFQGYENIKIYELLDPPAPRICYQLTKRGLAAEKRHNIQDFRARLNTYIRNRGLDSLI